MKVTAMDDGWFYFGLGFVSGMALLTVCVLISLITGAL